MGGGLQENKCHLRGHLLHVRSLHSLKGRGNCSFLERGQGLLLPSRRLKRLHEIVIPGCVYSSHPIPDLRVLFFPYQDLDADIAYLLKLYI